MRGTPRPTKLGLNKLEALVELSEQLSRVRAEALQMLGKQPE